MTLPFGLVLAAPTWGWLLLPGLGGLLLLYTVRSQPKVRVLPSIRIWKLVLARKRPNTFLSRFQQSLFLLLQLLVLFFALGSLTRPEISSPTGGDMLVAVDVGASMGAGDGRFAAALETVRSLLARRSEGARVQLVAAADPPRILGEPSADPGELARQVGALKVSADSGPRPGELLAFLQRLRRPTTRAVHVVSDSLGRDALAPGIPDVRLFLHHVGTSRDNVGITRLDVRPDRDAWQVSVLVRNFSGAPAEVEVELLAAAKAPTQKGHVAALGREQLFVFKGARPKDGVVGARVSVLKGLPDRLRTDDEAHSAPRRGAARMLLVAAAGDPVKRALELNPAIEVVPIPPQAFPAQKAGLPGFDMVVSDGFHDPALDGIGLLWFQGDGASPFSTGRVLPPFEPTRADGTHPLMRYLSFQQVAFLKAHALDKVVSGRTILDSDLGPLVVAVEEEKARRILCAFPLSGTDLPQHVAFPIFLTNAVRWILANDSKLQGHFTVGATIRVKGGKPVAVIDPAGNRKEYPAAPEPMLAIQPFETTGVHMVQRAGEPALAFPVNLLDPSESDIRPAGEGTEEIGDAAAAAGTGGETGLWRQLLGAALGLLFLEWLLLAARGGAG